MNSCGYCYAKFLRIAYVCMCDVYFKLKHTEVHEFVPKTNKNELMF